MRSPLWVCRTGYLRPFTRIDLAYASDGHWWYRLYFQTFLGQREIRETRVPGGWKQLEDAQLLSVVGIRKWTLSRDTASVPVKAREGAALADRLLADCLGRKT